MSIKHKIKKVIELSYYIPNIKDSDNFKLAFNCLRLKLLKLYIRHFEINENMSRKILDYA